jgi:hypothetical protein
MGPPQDYINSPVVNQKSVVERDGIEEVQKSTTQLECKKKTCAL